MTMVLPLLPDRIRSNPRYYGDHLIRHYRPLGLAAYIADHDMCPSTPSVTITGGIGTLTMHADGREDWRPAVTTVRADLSTVRLGDPAPAPLVAPAALAASRRAICSSCNGWSSDRCTVAGCSCNSMGQPGNLYSRCPRDLWPAAPL
jgi:hypothetical protein